MKHGHCSQMDGMVCGKEDHVDGKVRGQAEWKS